MKVALVGFGYWGSKLLRNLVELVGPRRIVLVETHLGRLDTACTQYPGIAVQARLEDALADDEVTAVVVATPAESHAALVARSLRAGRHVLVEKPLASCTADAAELVELAEARRLALTVGHTFLFSPRVQWIADRITAGSLGEIRYLMSSRLNLGRHRLDANVIWDLAPHDFSIILHLLGEAPATVQTAAQSVTRDGVPDVAFINLSFPSGAIASVSVSWMAPRKVRNMTIVGRENMIIYDDTDGDEPVKLHNKGVVAAESPSFGEHQLTYRYGDTIAPYIEAQEPLARQLTHFLDAAAGGHNGISDGTFGLRVVQALEAADQSWRHGSIPIEPTALTAGTRS